jgi:hypothetical protein
MADLTTLQTWLKEAEAAKHKLALGAMEASVGSGDTQVSFSRTSVVELDNYIASLKRRIAQAQGISTAGSRRLEFYY